MEEPADLPPGVTAAATARDAGFVDALAVRRVEIERIEQAVAPPERHAIIGTRAACGALRVAPALMSCDELPRGKTDKGRNITPHPSNVYLIDRSIAVHIYARPHDGGSVAA